MNSLKRRLRPQSGNGNQTARGASGARSGSPMRWCSLPARPIGRRSKSASAAQAEEKEQRPTGVDYSFQNERLYDAKKFDTFHTPSKLDSALGSPTLNSLGPIPNMMTDCSGKGCDLGKFLAGLKKELEGIWKVHVEQVRWDSMASIEHNRSLTSEIVEVLREAKRDTLQRETELRDLVDRVEQITAQGVLKKLVEQKEVLNIVEKRLDTQTKALGGVEYRIDAQAKAMDRLESKLATQTEALQKSMQDLASPVLKKVNKIRSLLPPVPVLEAFGSRLDAALEDLVPRLLDGVDPKVKTVHDDISALDFKFIGLKTGLEKEWKDARKFWEDQASILKNVPTMVKDSIDPKCDELISSVEVANQAVADCTSKCEDLFSQLQGSLPKLIDECTERVVLTATGGLQASVADLRTWLGEREAHWEQVADEDCKMWITLQEALQLTLSSVEELQRSTAHVPKLPFAGPTPALEARWGDEFKSVREELGRLRGVLERGELPCRITEASVQEFRKAIVADWSEQRESWLAALRVDISSLKEQISLLATQFNQERPSDKALAESLSKIEQAISETRSWLEEHSKSLAKTLCEEHAKQVETNMEALEGTIGTKCGGVQSSVEALGGPLAALREAVEDGTNKCVKEQGATQASILQELKTIREIADPKCDGFVVSATAIAQAVAKSSSSSHAEVLTNLLPGMLTVSIDPRLAGLTTSIGDLRDSLASRDEQFRQAMEQGTKQCVDGQALVLNDLKMLREVVDPKCGGTLVSDTATATSSSTAIAVAQAVSASFSAHLDAKALEDMLPKLLQDGLDSKFGSQERIQQGERKKTCKLVFFQCCATTLSVAILLAPAYYFFVQDNS